MGQTQTSSDTLLFLNGSGDMTILGTLFQGSDINRKEEIIRIDTENILEKISSIPILEWQYKGSSERHIGPMAQDFYAAFGLGKGETTIATVDADGVALAGIQALYERLQESENGLQAVQLENEKLTQVVQDLISKNVKLENQVQQILVKLNASDKE